MGGFMVSGGLHEVQPRARAMDIAKVLAKRQSRKMEDGEDTEIQLTQLRTTVNLGYYKNGRGPNQIELAGKDPGFTF
jgi:hypothetical protein